MALKTASFGSERGFAVDDSCAFAAKRKMGELVMLHRRELLSRGEGGFIPDVRVIFRHCYEGSLMCGFWLV